MIIYIRHSQEDTDPTYLDDPLLTEKGQRLAYKRGIRLIEKYGIPDIVYCSPFRRTKETMKYMLKDIDSRENDIDIKIRGSLSRYFKTRDKKYADVCDKTLNKNIPIYEDRREFYFRVEHVYDKMEKYRHSNKIIWCITHTSLYKEIADMYDISLPKHIPYMHYIKIK